MTAAAPRFSVVLTVPADITELDLISPTVASVRAQSFPDWELIIVAASGRSVPVLDGADLRIRLLAVETDADDAAMCNRALAAALGEFVILATTGDTMSDDALGRVAALVAADPGIDVIYTDEEVPGTTEGSDRIVVRKPDWSPERLRHGDYVGGLCVMRTSVVRDVGGCRSGFGGAQDYDLTLRVTERARRVAHLPFVLNSRRSRPVEPGPDDQWTAIRAAQEQVERLGIAATVSPGPAAGYHRLSRRLDPAVAVSIIVPTRGQTGVVNGTQRCYVVEAVRSALARTAHPNVEVVVVYDDPTPADVLAELRAIAGDRFVGVPYSEPFNFSEKCNLGFLQAGGDIVVLLNDDTEAMSQGWLEALVAPLAEADVGMTGAKLYYADRTIQHGGHLYASGVGTPRPWHAFMWSPDVPTELGSLVVTRECSGVTAACAALRREVYEQVGGLTESLPVNFNDVDLSLKIRRAGLRILWVADCELYHFESQTRVPAVAPWETEAIAKRWDGSFGRDCYLPWLEFKTRRDFQIR